ncbi:type II toxin-antitoxin system Phd/YefM family antitoxin [Sphingomonas ursincola]|uniref:type II toxin-antitoxin system Phd/YefM family antitoxin n=1 Tax=Sphingomonas ursincola TaxID=56361 RepID=UPI002352A2EF|nr:type II toxin-antitoxin system prevent-host-death family antitoxin [Sphingomonas ursincola]MBY0618943.1 type II toxin-antitoxin system prevent-host-death family antitoxin [Sphingomonas ursincola]
MELSIREAKARFSEAIAAAMRGERVVITRHGRAVVELTSAMAKRPLNFAAADAYLAEIGWNSSAIRLPENFDDPAFSRDVLGLED